LPQDIVAQAVEEPAVLLGDHRGELGGRLGADDPQQEVILVVVALDVQVGGGSDGPPPPFWRIWRRPGSRLCVT
jgi:hypothetical protein